MSILRFFLSLVFKCWGSNVFNIIGLSFWNKKRDYKQKIWYIKRFFRIYFPYIVVVVTSVIMMYLQCSNYFNFNQFIIQIFSLQGIFGCYKNLTHLWYITYILVCYLITPQLQKLYKKINLRITNLFGIFLLEVCTF